MDTEHHPGTVPRDRTDLQHGQRVRDTQRAAVLLAVVILALIAVGAFVLAYRGQTDYMVTVAQYPRDTAWVGPAVVEGTLAMTLLAGLAVPLDGWARFWVWVSMALSSAGSVFGNVAVARDRHLSPAGVVTHGSWSVWVILAEVTAVIIVRKVWPWTQPGGQVLRVTDERQGQDFGLGLLTADPMPQREPGSSLRFADDRSTVTEAVPAMDPPVLTRGGLSLVGRQVTMDQGQAMDVSSYRPVEGHPGPEPSAGSDSELTLAVLGWVGNNGATKPMDKATAEGLATAYGVGVKTVRRRLADARKAMA